MELRGLLHCNPARQPITSSQLPRPESRFCPEYSCFKRKNRTLLRSNNIPFSVVSVVGDTLEVLHNQHPERIRLSGIDCPQKRQAFGKKAKHAASDLAFEKEVTIQTQGYDKQADDFPCASTILDPRKGHSMVPVRAGLLIAFLVVTTEAWGQVSIGSLRSSVDSSNLELVTLQGVVHLSRSRQNELGGKCGNTTFTLQDDTGSIEVAIRRSNRLIEPLREGDRVRLTARIAVFRNRENVPVRICYEARDIEHLGQ